MTAATGNPPAVDRPRFAEGQVLSAEDLSAQQAYLRLARRRHLLAAHGPGVVTGLELSFEDGTLTVSPGYAIDWCGRELVVPLALTVPAASIDTTSGGELGVWLGYELEACGTDPGHPRLCERPQVSVGPLADRAPPQPVDPTALPDDDAAADWALLLGGLTNGGTTIDTSGRAYSGAVGTAVLDPRQAARVGIGDSVYVTTGVGGVSLLEVDATGVSVAGGASLRGPLTVQGPARLSRIAAPTAAAPWSVHRCLVTTPARPGTIAVPSAEELRIELAAPPPGPIATQQGMSFGGRAAGGDFERAMSVLSDGTLVVAGDVVIEGRLATSPTPADASDPRLRAAVIDQFVRSATTTIDVLYEVYTGKLALESLTLALVGGGQISCGVLVRNTGESTVSSIDVAAAVTVAGAVQRSQTLASGLSLDPRASQTVSATFGVSGQGLASVTVTAAGKGAQAAGVSAPPISGTIQI